MAVAVDSSGTNNTNQDAVTTIDLTSLTVGTGANRVLIAILMFGSSAGPLPTGVSVTWNSVALTQVLTATTTNNFMRTELWRLINPTAGNLTLTASWTNSNDCVLGGIEFSGVDQTTPIVTGDNKTATGSSTTPDVVVPSATGDATVAGALSNSGSFTGQTQTLIFANNAPTNESADATYALGGTSNDHSFTLNGSGPWAAAGIHIQKVAATTTPIVFNRLPFLGVG